MIKLTPRAAIARLKKRARAEQRLRQEMTLLLAEAMYAAQLLQLAQSLGAFDEDIIPMGPGGDA